MYSKLGGCLGDTAKLDPLARTDLCAGVKGLLDRLMTHFGLGSSREDPWGSLLGLLGVGLPSQKPVLSAWEAVLFPWEAWRVLCLVEHLGLCLPDLVVTWLPAWLEGRLLPAWEGLSPAGVFVLALLPAWEEALSPGMGETAWVVTAKLLPSPEERRASAWLPASMAWEATKLHPSPEGRWAPAWLTAWEAGDGTKLLPSLGGRWAPAWEVNKLLPSPEGRWAPACLRCC